MEERRATPIQAQPTTGQSSATSVEGHVMPQDATKQAGSTNVSNDVLEDVKRLLDDIKQDRTVYNEKEQRRGFPDGSKMEWSWDTGEPVSEHPLFAVARDAMQLSVGEAQTNYTDVAEVIRLAINYTQNDDPGELFVFLQDILRKTPQVGNRITSLRRYLEIMTKKGGGI